MKKLLAIVLSAAMLVASVVAFSACGETTKVRVFDAEVFELTAESYAFAVKKGDSDVKTQANALLAEITENGTLDMIINSFFDGSSDFTYENTVSSPPTGANKTNYLIVATNAYFPPFEYYQGSVFTGVDIQIAKLLADKMEKTLYVSDMEFDSIIPSITSGNCDIAMAGMTVKEERLETVDFTTEYYESAQVLITRENDERFADCQNADDLTAVLSAQGKSFTIGTQVGTTGYMYSVGEGSDYEGFANLTTTSYSTGALAVQDLINNKISAVIIDKQPALMIAANYNK